MREKVCDFIYLDSERYMSLNNLKVFYWGAIIIPFCMIVMGVVSIRLIGVSWKSLFPLVSIATWSLMYWVFVLTIQSKRTKKDFALRFLVNGISGLLLSSLFWIFMASFNILSDTPFLDFHSMLWMLLLYLLVTLVYIFIIVFCVHKGVFALIREKHKTKTALKVSACLGAMLPASGVIGMCTSQFIRSYGRINTQLWVMTLLTSLLFFLPAVAHINFVQYFYCKKYAIDCDEAGNKTSPALERRPKAVKKIKQTLISERAKVTPSTKADCSSGIPSKKKIPLIIKILTGIVSVPIFFFIIVFLVFLIKTIIEKV